MKRKRFTEEQIIGALKEVEAGLPISEVCRTYGISDATFSKAHTICYGRARVALGPSRPGATRAPVSETSAVIAGPSCVDRSVMVTHRNRRLVAN